MQATSWDKGPFFPNFPYCECEESTKISRMSVDNELFLPDGEGEGTFCMRLSSSRPYSWHECNKYGEVDKIRIDAGE